MQGAVARAFEAAGDNKTSPYSDPDHLSEMTTTGHAISFLSRLVQYIYPLALLSYFLHLKRI